MELFQKHESTLNDAVSANHSRKFYAKFPEAPSPKIWGETADADGKKAFENHLGKSFDDLVQESDAWVVGDEESPFTREKLGISYPAFKNVDSYVQKSQVAAVAWQKLDVKSRLGILTESLERFSRRFFELAYATQHTTGQSFIMSFQASGPHAADRCLEVLGFAYEELTKFAESVEWEKPMGKITIKLQKKFRATPKGIGLCIGCSTFPVWNTGPGLYASLVTGNPVIVKPHPKVIYPIAMMVSELQKLLKENGLDPHVVQLAVDTVAHPLTKKIAENPAVKLVDYTGGSAFGDYVEALPGKVSFTEKAGVNSVILDSTQDLKATMQNLAFSVALYSGQMCTRPQNFFIPKNGMKVGEAHVSYEEVVAAFVGAMNDLVNNEKMGPGTLAAIQADMTLARISELKKSGLKILLDSKNINNPEFPKARTASPIVVEVPAQREDVYSQELFGPVALIIPTDDTAQSLKLAQKLAQTKGAISCAAYTTNPTVMNDIEEGMAKAFTPVSFNLTGFIWVNQHAAFSDFHVSGGNPAGNASLADPEFITKRFEMTWSRRLVQ